MAAAFVLLGGAVTGMRALGPSMVHAQAPSAQIKQAAPEKGEVVEVQGKESAKTSEPANEQAQEKNLAGSGHQDANGTNVDHQFEGVE